METMPTAYMQIRMAAAKPLVTHLLAADIALSMSLNLLGLELPSRPLKFASMENHIPL